MSDINLKDFIKDLESLNEENTISINVPSCDKSFKFKLINVSQHKELLKSAFEGYEGVIRSNVIFNDIITANCEGECEFSLMDKVPVLLQLRKASIGDDISVGDDTYKLSDLPQIDETFESVGTKEYNGIEVVLKVPSLERDNKVSAQLIKEFHKLSDTDKDTEAINLVLTFEIIKFIESVTINGSTFVFDAYNSYDCRKLVDALPLKLNNMIIEFITSYRTFENKFLTFDDGTILEIDAGFLSSE